MFCICGSAIPRAYRCIVIGTAIDFYADIAIAIAVETDEISIGRRIGKGDREFAFLIAESSGKFAFFVAPINLTDFGKPEKLPEKVLAQIRQVFRVYPFGAY